MSLLMDALRRAEESKQRTNKSQAAADTSAQPLTESQEAEPALALDWEYTLDDNAISDADIVQEKHFSHKSTSSPSPQHDVTPPNVENAEPADTATSATEETRAETTAAETAEAATSAATADEVNSPSASDSDTTGSQLFDMPLKWANSDWQIEADKKMAVAVKPTAATADTEEEVTKAVLEWDDSLADLFAQEPANKTDKPRSTESASATTAPHSPSESNVTETEAETALPPLDMQPADIDPNEVEWALELDKALTTESEEELALDVPADSSLVASPALEQLALFEASETTSANAETDPPLNSNSSTAETAKPEVDWAHVSIESPDVSTEVSEAAPSQTAADPTARIDTAVPTLNLDIDDLLNDPLAKPTQETTASEPAKATTKLDTDQLNSEGGLMGVTSAPVEENDLFVPPSFTAQRKDDASKLEWDDEIFSNINADNVASSETNGRSKATVDEQTAAQKKAQTLLHQPRSRNNTRWMTMYALLGLSFIALLGIFAVQFVINEQMYADKNKTQYNIVNNSDVAPPTPATALATTVIEPDIEPERPATTSTAPLATTTDSEPVPPATDVALTEPETTTANPVMDSESAAGVVNADSGQTLAENENTTATTASAPPTTPVENTSTDNDTALQPENLQQDTSPDSTQSTIASVDKQSPPPYPHSMDDSVAARLSNPVPEIQRNDAVLRAQKLNNALNSAYGALQNQRLEQAHSLYQQALQQDAANRDALLGLARIALQQNQPLQAQQHYQQVLKHYPQDRAARLGLLAASRHTQPARSERELRELLNEETADKGYVNFALGSLYASQSRWAAAQQAFFDAWRHDKQQANYAYNLAVSLEHLGQPKTAIQYYQQALQLAQRSTAQASNFDLQTVQKRVQTLLAQNGNADLSQQLMWE